jgi:tryptophan synthase alpha chain
MIEHVFQRARNRGRAAFIAYVMAGDPDASTTAAVLRALSEAGVDLIELGVPYGDPLADGRTIAAAAGRALSNGTRLADVFALVEQHCGTGGAPVVLFTYFNPAYQYGIDRFAREASEAGAIGLIVPDLALDESAELRASAAAHGLQMPLLVAPTTSPQRAARIAAAASGFVYVVSRLGVTGANSAPDVPAMARQLVMLRGVTQKPLAVGFGISRADDVRHAASIADGVVVGSALIDAYVAKRGAEAARLALAFVQPLLAAAVWKDGVRAS